MKGHIHSHHNNGSRGRSTHAVLVLLAFGVAIFGVVIVHKLRERRMFNMLVKDKEIELIHLKLLLQVHSLHLLCRVMCHVSCVSVSLFSVSGTSITSFSRLFFVLNQEFYQKQPLYLRGEVVIRTAYTTFPRPYFVGI